MRDQIEISCTPWAEDCEQLGRDYRPHIARAECRAFANQIRRVIGEEPGNARLKITSNPHDFGTYHEVACIYNSDSEVETDYAFKCESGDGLEYWDAEARAELSKVEGYPIDRFAEVV